MLCRPWEPAVVGLAEAVSLPADQIKYVSALLAGIPIGFVFRAITADPFAKEVCPLPRSKQRALQALREGAPPPRTHWIGPLT